MWVPKHLATYKILVKKYDGLNENGAKNFTEEVTVKAAMFNDFSPVYTSEGERKRLSAKAYIFEDLEKLDKEMTAICVIDGKEYLVNHVSEKRDMYGHLNHFELGLI